MGVGIFGPELIQELIPGVLVIRRQDIVGPRAHAIFPVAHFFSCDEGQGEVDPGNERRNGRVVPVEGKVSQEVR